MFKTIATESFPEIQYRRNLRSRLMEFGIGILDDALRGILPDDLILIGAQSGLGKTQICCNIAMANMENGKRVHFIALEAGEFEITRRLKYPLVMERFYADDDRPSLGKIDFTNWMLGDYLNEMEAHEQSAAEFFEKAYGNLFMFHKADKFGLAELIESVCFGAKDSDLIIIDHVHYFDLEDDNENRALKEIAKTVRSLALEEQKPIILIAHLRKKDRGNKELCPGMEEFHGSSDLYKIATRVITLSPGRPLPDGAGYETYFRIPKNRFDGGVSRFVYQTVFNPRKGSYEKEYKFCWAGSEKFEEIIDKSILPSWAKDFGRRQTEENSGYSSGGYVSKGKPKAFSYSER